jgi:hypothetical protein
MSAAGIGRRLAGLAGIAVMVAACGTVIRPPSAQRGVAGSGHAATASLAQPQRAKADAAAILAAFVPPPGAVRLPHPPGGVGGVLSQPDGTPSFQHLIDDAAWWQVPGTPLAALTYAKAHLPGRFTLNGESWGAIPAAEQPRGPGGAAPQDPYQRAGYTFDVTSGLAPLEIAQMLVDTARSPSGQTYLRVDAQLAWTPARPAAEAVPAAAKVVTITAAPDMNSPRDTPAPVTVTDPAKVSRIVALLDRLPLDSRGMHGCPLETGKAITLAFLPRAGGPVLATAAVPLPSCGTVSFAIGGRKQPGLSDSSSFAQHVLAIAGVRWHGYNT